MNKQASLDPVPKHTITIGNTLHFTWKIFFISFSIELYWSTLLFSFANTFFYIGAL